MAATETGVDAARELDELYRQHAPEVYRYVYAVLGDSSDAEDITQTTFVNALRALERGERPRKPTNWLITIAHNLIRQRFRQQATRPHEVELDRDVPASEADDDGPSIDDLVRALQRIPAPQREALVLREMEGRSYREISAILGVSQAALEARIFRARRSLAAALENLDRCDRAELALSRNVDGRLGRRDRKLLLAHLEECPSCARVVVLGMRRRRSFKALALVPLPFSLTLFKGTPSATAAAGAAGTAAGVGTVGVTAKIAIGLATVAVAGGAGYGGVKAVHAPATSERPAKVVPAAVVPAAVVPATIVPATVLPAAAVRDARPPAATRTPPGLAKGKPKPRVARIKPARATVPAKGRSATAPGHTKVLPQPPLKAVAKPRAVSKPKTAPPAKEPRGVGPATAPASGKSPTARDRAHPVAEPKRVAPVANVSNEGRERRSAARPSDPPARSG